jgi:hypothetical protein
MIKIKKEDIYNGKLITITTDVHWSDGVISIRDQKDINRKAEIDVGYSSGGVNDQVHPVDLCQRMVEAWTEALEIVTNIDARNKELETTIKGEYNG